MNRWLVYSKRVHVFVQQLQHCVARLTGTADSAVVTWTHVVLGGSVEALLTRGALGPGGLVALFLHIPSWRHKQSGDVTKVAELLKSHTLHSEAAAQSCRSWRRSCGPTCIADVAASPVFAAEVLLILAARLSHDQPILHSFVRLSKYPSWRRQTPSYCMKSCPEPVSTRQGIALWDSVMFSCSLLLFFVGSSYYMHDDVSPPCPAFPISLVLSDPTQWKTPQNIFFCRCRFKKCSPLSVCLRSLYMTLALSLLVSFLCLSPRTTRSCSCAAAGPEARFWHFRQSAQWGISSPSSTPFPFTLSPIVHDDPLAQRWSCNCK